MTKYATCLFLLIFVKIFGVISIDYEKCTKSILNILEYSTTTSVFLFYPDDDSEEMDLQNITKMHNLGMNLSRASFSVTSTSLSKVSEVIKKNYAENQRSLFVVFLVTAKSLKELDIMSNKVEITSPKWLLIYGEEMRDFKEEGNKILTIFREKTEEFVLFQSPSHFESANHTKIFNIDTWNSEKVNPAKKVKSRKNLNGIKLNVGVVRNPSIKIGRNRLNQGFYDSILNALEKSLNFSTGSMIEDDLYGNKIIKDGKWDGMIGKVASGKVDIGIAIFGMTSSRWDAIDFTHPVAKAYACLYVKKPDTYVVSWLAYFEVVSYGNWSTLLLTILTSALLIALVKKHNEHGNQLTSEFSNSIFNIWKILCQQGTEEKSKKWPVKIIILSTYVTFFLVSSIYSAVIASYLVVLKPSLPFHDLESFLHVKSHDLIVENEILHEWIDSNDTQAMRLAKLLKKNVPRTELEAAAQVCNEKVALLAIQPIFRAESKDYPCKLVEIKMRNDYHFAMILRKNSPYKEMINTQILRSYEDGTLFRLMEKFGYITDSVGEKRTIGTQLDLKSLGPIFVLFIFGFTLSILFYLIEKLCKIL